MPEIYDFDLKMKPKWGSKEGQTGSIIGPRIDASFCAMLEAFWFPFWIQRWHTLRFIFDRFLDLAKNSIPLENTTNNSHIEGRTPLKTKKKPFKNRTKTVLKQKRKTNAVVIDFWSILESVFPHFGGSKCLQN